MGAFCPVSQSDVREYLADLLFLDPNDPQLQESMESMHPNPLSVQEPLPIAHRYRGAVEATQQHASTQGEDYRPPLSGAGRDGTLGSIVSDSIKKAAVRIFKQRAPRPESLHVKVFTSASKVSWAQVCALCVRRAAGALYARSNSWWVREGACKNTLSLYIYI